MKYLRGKKYNLAKKPVGRPVNKLYQNDTISSTRQQVAKQTGVSEATVSRAGKYAEALDTLTDAVDPQVKQDVFRNDIRATDEEVLQLADLAKEQPDVAKQVVREARDTKSKGGTVGQALNKIAKKKQRREERTNKIVQITEDNRELNAGLGQFNVIYADPPWRYEHSKTDNRQIDALNTKQMVAQETELLTTSYRVAICHARK